jgi:hypothetical protein
VFADKLIDPRPGLIAFDTFNTDGFLGTCSSVNGKVQPYHPVQKRRYRFRVLGRRAVALLRVLPYQPGEPEPEDPVLGHLERRQPVPAARSRSRASASAWPSAFDIIVDFNKIAQRFGNPPVIRLENRLEQDDGRGPTGKILPAGQGDQVLEFRLVGTRRATPASTRARVVPARAGDGRRRRVRADRAAGHQPGDAAASPARSSSSAATAVADERAVHGLHRFRLHAQAQHGGAVDLQNDSGGWQHPIHIHSRSSASSAATGSGAARATCSSRARTSRSRRRARRAAHALPRLQGRLPIHCHNTVHEDHQMMLLWNVADVGDNRPDARR